MYIFMFFCLSIELFKLDMFIVFIGMVFSLLDMLLVVEILVMVVMGGLMFVILLGVLE